ncbi:MAG: hypothetical protein ACKOH9_08475, partial [Actinomycetota bacterium]
MPAPSSTESLVSGRLVLGLGLVVVPGNVVVVNLPGVNDQQEALNIIGRTGELLLRPVLQSGIYNPDA